MRKEKKSTEKSSGILKGDGSPARGSKSPDDGCARCQCKRKHHGQKPGFYAHHRTRAGDTHPKMFPVLGLTYCQCPFCFCFCVEFVEPKGKEQKNAQCIFAPQD
jgi:hypothetical protein